MSTHMGGLARRLVSDKLIDEAQALAAMESATEAKIAFVSQLISSHDIDCYAIALAASEEFGAPLFDLDAFDSQHTPANLVDPRLIRKHNVLPLIKRANRLYLAVSDPANIEAFDEVKFAAGVGVEAIVVEEDKLARAITSTMKKTATPHWATSTISPSMIWISSTRSRSKNRKKATATRRPSSASSIKYYSMPFEPAPPIFMSNPMKKPTASAFVPMASCMR